MPVLVDLPLFVGRYVIVAELGNGGMGRVLRGYDPELQRIVAIKMLHALGGPPAVARLRREAAVLARLAHPGVVDVFEVGLEGDTPYIVMEFVHGTTLRDWLVQPHTADEILRVFADAGEALHAAHLAGIVHRDFKPDNVMVGNDGRVKVLDFGLAWLGEEAAPTDPQNSRPSSVSGRLTETGTRLGTPAYMSPEQHMGGSSGPASDQFSFCVALTEALHRMHPFRASSVEALYNAIVRQHAALPPCRGRAERKLRAALLRGMRVEPRERWPSMRTLLDALDTGPGRRAPLLAALASVAVVGLGFAWPAGAQPTAAAGVEGRAASEAPVDARQARDVQAVRASLRESRAMLTAGAFAEARAAAVDALVAADATEFEPAIAEANFAVGSADAALGNRPEAKQRLETTYYAALATGHDELAVEVAHRLVLFNAGEGEDPARLQHWLKAAASVLDRLPADNEEQVWHLHWQAVVIGEAGDGEEAIDAHRAACSKFAELGLSDNAKSRCLDALATALADASRFDEAREAAERSLELGIADLGLKNPSVATAHANYGLILLQAGAVNEAEAKIRKGVELYDATVGRNHPQAANARTILANALFVRGAFSEAEPLLLEAVEVLAQSKGGAAPQTIAARSNLAVVYTEIGRVDDAEALLHAQSAALSASGQGRSIFAAEVLVNLGAIAGMKEQPEVAEERLTRALVTLDEVPGTRLEAFARVRLAQAKLDQGEVDAAIDSLMHARSLLVETLGDSSPDLADALGILGNAEHDAGRFAAAATALAEAAEMYKATVGPDHPSRAEVLRFQAHNLRHLGKRKQARALERRAKAIAPVPAQ